MLEFAFTLPELSDGDSNLFPTRIQENCEHSSKRLRRLSFTLKLRRAVLPETVPKSGNTVVVTDDN